MHDKYPQSRTRGVVASTPDDGVAIEPVVACAAEIAGRTFAPETYAAAGRLRAALDSQRHWFPFSAAGLSVGPSVLPNFLRIDLVANDGAPLALLMTLSDLTSWLAQLGA
jgi:hypothetical protein